MLTLREKRLERQPEYRLVSTQQAHEVVALPQVGFHIAQRNHLLPLSVADLENSTRGMKAGTTVLETGLRELRNLFSNSASGQMFLIPEM